MIEVARFREISAKIAVCVGAAALVFGLEAQDTNQERVAPERAADMPPGGFHYNKVSNTSGTTTVTNQHNGLRVNNGSGHGQAIMYANPVTNTPPKLRVTN